MKLKDGFSLRKVGENYYIFKNLTDKNSEVEVFSINETGVFLWKFLKNGEQTVPSLAEFLSTLAQY